MLLAFPPMNSLTLWCPEAAWAEIKEAPAMGRGLESREETPKEGERTDRTF
jgi:hypothetical protein